MKKLQLKITSTQIYDTHQDTEEKKVQATVGERSGTYYILFKEVDEESKMSIDNTLKLKNNTVMLKRSGGLTTDLYFDIEKPYTTVYHTPYNQMEITILTHTIEKQIDNDYITLKLHYEILMQGQKISDNIYIISNDVEL